MSYLKVGNSRVIFWQGRKAVSWPRSRFRLADLRGRLKSSDTLWVVSVVPEWTKKLKTAFGNRVRIFSAREFSFSGFYQGMGEDRALNLWGARSLHKTNILVVDMGTAVTVDFLTKEGRYLGGWISAGPLPQAIGLHKAAPRLPRVALKGRRKRGRSTKECLEAGQYQILQGILDRSFIEARQLFKENFTAILTGGWASIMSDKRFRSVPSLALIGLKKAREMKR